MSNQELKETIRLLLDRDSEMLDFLNSRDRLSMPSLDRLKEIVDLLNEIIFPGYFGKPKISQSNLSFYLGVNLDQLNDLLIEEIKSGLNYSKIINNEIEEDLLELSKIKAKAFIERIPHIRALLLKDVEATYLGDPASKSKGEIIYCYPGIKAISNHRIAHELLKLEVPLIPRIISEMAHSETGIDIHPAADIGEYFAIDHGTGIVIGETCIIGNHVKIYQGVTLGAKSFPLDDDGNPIKGIPRHPMVKDHAIIYSGASILGRITIGTHAMIGGNVWITEDVEDHSKVLQRRAKEQSFYSGSGI